MQKPCSHYGIPGIIICRSHFTQVKTYDPAPGGGQQVQQVVNLLKTESAWDRSACVRTQVGRQPVYVKTDIPWSGRLSMILWQ